MAAKRRDKVKSELDLLGLDVLATETGLIGQVVGGRRGKHCRGAPTASQPMIDPRPCPGGCILRLGVREPFRHAPNHTVDALAVDHDIDGPPTVTVQCPVLDAATSDDADRKSTRLNSSH